MEQKKYLITVTKNDIKNGYERNSSLCPVAIAISRKFGRPSRWFYSSGYAKNDFVVACNRTAIDRWVVSFDTSKKVNPIKFYVKIEG